MLNRKLTVVLGILLGSAFTAHAGTMVGPLPYVSVLDRPAGFFSSISDGELICFEDFEGDPIHGYTADMGSRIGPNTISGDGVAVTDSVDADDGSIDGLGLGGSSLFSGADMRVLQFSFEAPTDVVGFVVTDGDSSATKLIVEAFNAAGELICDHEIDAFFDDVFTGTTSEDRFIGLQAEGISRVRISLDRGTGIEIDHLQFVKPVPEPSTLTLLLLSVGGVFGAFRPRRTA